MSKPFLPPLVYHDGISIFLEWPDHVQRFLYTEAGLSKALKLIPHIASDPGYVTGRSNIADKLIDNKAIKIAKKTQVRRQLSKATEGQRRSASEAIRRMRMKSE